MDFGQYNSMLGSFIRRHMELAKKNLNDRIVQFWTEEFYGLIIASGMDAIGQKDDF